jgi:hypothetical protein
VSGFAELGIAPGARLGTNRTGGTDMVVKEKISKAWQIMAGKAKKIVGKRHEDKLSTSSATR